MKIPALILGGTGYVAGELLRLLVAHPDLEIAGILSDSQPGELVANAFPHLAPALGKLTFCSEAEMTTLVSTLPTSALFSAAVLDSPAFILATDSDPAPSTGRAITVAFTEPPNRRS